MVISIYAALTSFAQRNLKRKIAYSSISHMGFVLIGMASFTDIGTSGAMLQDDFPRTDWGEFILYGRLYPDRTHTPDVRRDGRCRQENEESFCHVSRHPLPSLPSHLPRDERFCGRN